MSTWQTMGLRVVEVDGMAPDDWLIVSPGRFVQELARGEPSISFVAGSVKLNGKVRWEPARSDTNAPKET